MRVVFVRFVWVLLCMFFASGCLAKRAGRSSAPVRYPPPKPRPATVTPERLVRQCLQILFSTARYDPNDPATHSPEAARARPPAIEALVQACRYWPQLRERVGRMLTVNLDDPTQRGCYAAAVGIGKLRYEPAKEKLLQLARPGAAVQVVRLAAIFALDRLGDRRYTGEMAEMIMDRKDVRLRRCTAQLLAEMGEPTAVALIRYAMGYEKDVGARLEGQRAMALLGDKRAINQTKLSLSSGFGEDRMLAVETLALLKDPTAVRPLRAMLYDRLCQMEVKLKVIWALGMLGKPEALSLAVDNLNYTDPRGNRFHSSMVRTLAALAVGASGQFSLAGYLQPLLNSTDAQLRIAAADALLSLAAKSGKVKNLPPL